MTRNLLRLKPFAWQVRFLLWREWERHYVRHRPPGSKPAIIEAPTSTKNAEKQRDPEMHQVMKGNEWHFEERLYIGVYAGTAAECAPFPDRLPHEYRNRLHWNTRARGFDWDRSIEYQKSRVRSKVEYVFLIIKRLFGNRKVRYRSLEKNQTHAFILGSCANLFMLAQSGWSMSDGVA